ncbi:hypothetical protein [Chryseobacterium sp. SIMBA_028]
MKELKQYAAFAVAKDGTRHRIDATSIIIQLEEEEIEYRHILFFRGS